MKVEAIINLIKQKKSKLNNVYFGFLKITKDSLTNPISFKREDNLDRYANSQPEEFDQIVIKSTYGKRTFFIATKEYDVVLAEEGLSFRIIGYWERRESQDCGRSDFDIFKSKNEVIEHFKTERAKTPK